MSADQERILDRVMVHTVMREDYDRPGMGDLTLRMREWIGEYNLIISLIACPSHFNC